MAMREMHHDAGNRDARVLGNDLSNDPDEAILESHQVTRYKNNAIRCILGIPDAKRPRAYRIVDFLGGFSEPEVASQPNIER